MRDSLRRSRLFRAVALTLCYVLVLSSLPLEASQGRALKAPVESGPARPAAEADDNGTPAPASAPAPGVLVNRIVPRVAPAPAFPGFSAEPTTEEITRARVFGEPLLPLGEPTPLENQALARTILAGLQTLDISERLVLFEGFLHGHATSPWRASLLSNLGVLYRRNGYFTRAETALRQAWALSKEGTSAEAKTVAISALGELLDLYTRFGRIDPLDEMLAQAEGREIWGSPAERLREARMGSWILHNAHDRAIPSGPRALATLRSFLDPSASPSAEIEAFHADHDGATLLEMEQLARRSGLELQMARRTGKAPLPLPAVMHFKVGHFSAVLKQVGDRFLVEDPCLGGEIWMSAEALEEESSGYFLIPSGRLPSGWEKADEQAAASIRGKCAPGPSPNGECTSPCCGKTGPGCDGQSCAPGGPMAVYSFHSLLASLHIEDRPVGYSPPRGPAVSAFLSYNQRESYKPLAYTFTNLGTRWNLGWVAWIEDDPTNPNASVYAHLSGGGRETATGLSGNSFTPHRSSQAVISRTSTSPIGYERVLPDGSKEVYAQADGAQSAPRRVFLTQLVDTQGNALTFTYDSQLRLVSVTDAIGQVTTLFYDMVADPLKVTKITDPFGRAAQLEYDASRRLVGITDPIGIRSQFEYGDQEGNVTGDFVRALTTPYGTTTFRGTTGITYMTDYGVEATDPLGGKELIQWLATAPVPDSDPAASVPTGFSGRNNGLSTNSSFYFDKRAMMLHPGDYTKALHMKWNSATTGLWDSFSAVKRPLEGRVWYAYQQEPVTGHSVGPLNKPVKIARVLDDGSSQIYRYEYNPLGNVTRQTDPLGRETIHEYDANQTDLLRVKRKNGNNYDLQVSRTFNGQHQPLTATDASGKTTTLTYNAQGQVTSVTTPKAAGQAQGLASTFTYDANGYLTSVSGPVSGATISFTYDGYGRRRTVTDTAALTLTLDYDALDRMTRITYPDGTYEETVYNRLDVERLRDRLGRWTERFYDALRRAVTVRDPQGGLATYQWCTCGSLDKLVDANGNATSWEYDLQGRVIKDTRPNGSFTTYTYENTASRSKTITDRRSVTTTLAYNLDDRIAGRSFSDGTSAITYSYDPVTGLLASASNSTDTLSWTYDANDRVASEASSKNSSTISYSYDDAGNRTALILNGTTFLTYAHDQTSRLTGITRGTSTFTFGYDTASRRTSLTLPNGVSTAYSYDAESRLTSLVISLSGTPFASYGYTYDAVGNRSQKATLDWTETYGYDRLSRLVSVRRSTGSPSRWAYVYDAVGNRTTEQVDDSPTSATFNNLNHLLGKQAGGSLAFRGTLNEPATATVQGTPAAVGSDNSFAGQATVSGGTNTVQVTATDPSGNLRTNTYQVSVSGAGATFTYDANGNLASRAESGDNWTYEWSAENQLTRVTKNAAEVARFAYDPLGRRVEKTAGGLTTTYLLDSGNILRESRSDGTVFKYIHSRRLDEPIAREDGAGVLTYYHSDGLDSVVKRTNQAGQVTHTYRYDAWGAIEVGATEAGYAFTGREWDPEIQAYYFRARYYDPRTGRFLSEDPIRGKASLYAYVRNDPVNRVDPMGLQSVECRGCSPAQTQHVQNGMKTICDLLMKPGCAGAVHRWGLLPCYQKMCYRDKPPIFACGGEGPPDKCGGQGGPNTVVLYNKAFDPRGCLDTKLPATMAHEMSHICITGRGEGPGPDCDIPGKTQFGIPYCSDESRRITAQRTNEIEQNCGGR